MRTKVKTATEITAMRAGGKMLATVLQSVASQTKAGMSTKDLAEITKQELRALGGQPTSLGYQGFPDVICISVNDEVVHGIPRANRILNDGDIVSLDFVVTYQGMITDSALTIIIGQAPAEVQKLLQTTEASLMAGINAVRAGAYIGDISAAVQAVLEAAGLGVVRDLVGHGVGHQMHEEPNIPNYGKKGQGMKLEAGMTIAIEPMATLGGWQVTADDDGWTIRTADHSLSAHFEHTVLVTEGGAEILTQ